MKRRFTRILRNFAIFLSFGALILAIIELEDSFTSSFKTFSLAIILYFGTKVYSKAYWDNENAKEANEQERRAIASRSEITVSLALIGLFFYKAILKLLS